MHIVVIGSNRRYRRKHARFLKDAVGDCKVTRLKTPGDLLDAMCAGFAPDVIATDMLFPEGIQGLEFIGRLRMPKPEGFAFEGEIFVLLTRPNFLSEIINAGAEFVFLPDELPVLGRRLAKQLAEAAA